MDGEADKAGGFDGRGDGARNLHILLVEDNPGDVILLREAFADAGLVCCMYFAHDGVEAIEMLRGAGEQEGMPCPDVIVLDLNLPRRNGREVLEILARDAKLQAIPVAVLTTSRAEGEICGHFPQLRCMFAVKTSDFQELIDIARAITQFARDAMAG